MALRLSSCTSISALMARVFYGKEKREKAALCSRPFPGRLARDCVMGREPASVRLVTAAAAHCRRSFHCHRYRRCPGFAADYPLLALVSKRLPTVALVSSVATVALVSSVAIVVL
jgi:hypothetical protein